VRDQDVHLLYNERDGGGMSHASMALMQLVPIAPVEAQKVETSVGTSVVGTGIRMRNDLRRRELGHRAT